MTDEVILRAARLFAAMANPTRLQVLALLSEEGALSVGALSVRTGLEQSALSHHLRHLRDERLVESEPDGRRRLYRLHDAHVAHIVGDALRHVSEL